MAKSSESEPLRSDQFLELQASLADTFEVLTARLSFQGIAAVEAIPVVAGRIETMIECARGPIFDANGYIAPIQTYTEAELVVFFGTNHSRMNLLKRVRDWIHSARAVGAKRLLVDGSFITEKEEPADVDCAILLPGDFHDQVSAGNLDAIKLFTAITTREPKELLCAEVEEDWWRWVEFFGRTREASGRRKGLLEVVL